MCAFARLESFLTGDRFSDGKKQPEAAVIPPPPPHTQAFAIVAKDRKDEVRLAAALAKLTEEDPSLAYVQDQELAELKLFGQGEMHLRVIVERLAGRFDVVVETKKPSVAYRETIRDRGDGARPAQEAVRRPRPVRRRGGRGDAAQSRRRLRLRREGPRRHGAEAILLLGRDGRARRNEQRAARISVVDVGVTLIDGSYHTVDSSDMAFRAATKIALGEALPKARPVLLEPILAVTIYVPSDALARASALVSARRGQILGFEAREGWRGWEALARDDPRSRDRRPDRRAAFGDRRRRRVRDQVRSSRRDQRPRRRRDHRRPQTRRRVSPAWSLCLWIEPPSAVLAGLGPAIQAVSAGQSAVFHMRKASPLGWPGQARP